MRRIKLELQNSWIIVYSSLIAVWSVWKPESFVCAAGCVPRSGCSQALAVYPIVSENTTSALQAVLSMFNSGVELASRYNVITNTSIPRELRIPFDCKCINGFLQHEFIYQVAPDDTSLFTIAHNRFKGLTRHEWIQRATSLKDAAIFAGLNIKVPVNCSCGSPDVSPSYGLFATYVVQPGDSATKISPKFSLPADVQQLLPMYNTHISFQNLLAEDIIFIPVAELNGTYPPFTSDTGDGDGGVQTSAVIGASVGVSLAVVLGLVAGLWWWLAWRRNKRQQREEPAVSSVKTNTALVLSDTTGSSAPKSLTPRGTPTPSVSGTLQKSNFSTASVRSVLSDITMEKSVEFTYEELAAATNNFNETNKIGQGGYGSVYYGYFRDKKLAVKRMNMQASKEFLSELKVLSRVHHTNLVQLVGYCTVESLFLVYEFVDNGTLSQHLHSSNRPPLSWSSRVKIALDAARGLEYIHEHTKPTYIHRDVKSTNILIDRNFNAKVADFGLTKLTETGIMSVSLTQPTRLVGTFGYISPEYARFGDVSPLMDVYSFGIVLFEIVSAQEAIVRTGLSHPSDEQKGLVTLFEDVLQNPNGKERLRELVDPRLGDNYPLDGAWSLAKLGGACTKENPDLRPTMRTVVVALMTLMASSQEPPRVM